MPTATRESPASGRTHATASRPRHSLPPTGAFGAAALAYTALYFAAGAPTPLLVVFQQQWGFAPWVLTIAFAAYSVGLLAALLVAGSLSDHLGRRPVLAGSMVLELASMLLCAFAPNIGWVIAARTVQGIATGVASGAFTASIIELAPARHKKLGTVLSTIAPATGLGTGALFAGSAAQFTKHAPVKVFLVLALLIAAGTAATLLCAETSTRRPGAARSLIPTVTVPQAARREFLAAVPVHMGGWLLASMFMGLAPTIVGSLFHLHNGLLNGATVLAMQGPSALAGLVLGRIAPRRATVFGSAAIAIGAGLIVVSVAAGVLPLLWIGGAIGGAGFGTSFSGAIRAIAPLAGTHERAGLFAAVYLVAYLTFGLPVITAGFLVAPLGLLTTVTAYAVAIAASAVLGLLTQARMGRATGAARVATSSPDPTRSRASSCG